MMDAKEREQHLEAAQRIWMSDPDFHGPIEVFEQGYLAGVESQAPRIAETDIKLAETGQLVLSIQKNMDALLTQRAEQRDKIAALEARLAELTVPVFPNGFHALEYNTAACPTGAVMYFETEAERDTFMAWFTNLAMAAQSTVQPVSEGE